jgi:cysteine desulfurase
VTAKTEHKAVLDTCRHLETEGCEVTWLDPDPDGLIQPAAVAAALRDDTVLVSVMHVNNELGTLNDIAGIGAVCRARGVFYHVDAAQSAGKVPIDLARLPVDLMSFSAHKVYGPKGVGALYVRRRPRVELRAQMHGGGHERGMRSGTLATHQIAGMGEAFRIARAELVADAARIAALRERFWSAVRELGQVHLNGAPDRCVPGILSLSFGGVDGEVLLAALGDLAVSTGSACTSASLEPSHVLRALGLEDDLARSTLRFSMGRFTTAEDVDRAAAALRTTLTRLRGSDVAE